MYEVAISIHDILKRTFHRPLQAIIQLDSQINKAKTSSQSVPAQLALADSLKPLLKEYQRVDEHCASTFQLMLLRNFDASVQSMILDHFDSAGKIDTEEMLTLIETKLIRDSAIASGLNELHINRVSDSSKCAFCDRSHSSHLCRTFPSAEERKNEAMKKYLCIRCLQSGHIAKICSARCPQCEGAHHLIDVPGLCGVQVAGQSRLGRAEAGSYGRCQRCGSTNGLWRVVVISSMVVVPQSR